MTRSTIRRVAAGIGGGSLLVLASVVGMVAPAQAASLDVGPSATYTTIGAAIAAAGAGDTITVEPGTYTENVAINKAVTITSATHGAAVIQGGVTFTAVATLNGFAIHPLSNTIAAVQVAAGGGGSAILNNTIDGSTQTTASSTLIRVASGVGTAAAPTTVQGNTLENFSTAGQPSGIFISSTTFVDVVGNTIGNTGAIPAGSVAVNISNGAGSVLVQNNTISGVENAVAVLATTATPITNVTIDANTVSNTSLSAVVLSNANLQNVALTNNAFTDIAVGVTGRAAIQVGVTALPAPVGAPALDGVVVNANTVTNAPNGVVLNAGVRLVDAQSFSLADNTFSGITTDAVVVAPTVNASVAATDNNFGGAPVSGDVVVTAAPAATDPGLPLTGTDVVPPLLFAATLLLLGLLLLVLRRRVRLSARLR
jgi:LPXTG-motif cell wall-anchored protein